MNASDLFSDELPGWKSDVYDVEVEIGHGTFSEVHRARSKATGELVALKHMHLQQQDVLPVHVQREIDALQTLRHPNVVSLVDTCHQGYGICLVLQHCVASLWEVLQSASGRPLGSAVCKAIVQQLLRALQACHAAGFMHRDVAPTNILFDSEGGVRLADFGQARLVIPSPENGGTGDGGNTDGGAANSATPSVGTRWYMAPEVLFGSNQYGTTVDMWSVGCVLAELLTGRPLFPGASDIDQICCILGKLGSIDVARWPGVRELPDWGKLIFPQKQAQPWEQIAPGASPAALDLLQRLLKYNPYERMTAAEALQAEYFAEEPQPADAAAVAAAVRALLVPLKRPKTAGGAGSMPAFPPL